MFSEMQIGHGGMWDSTNNVTEGKVNPQLREMLHAHRGLSKMRRVKLPFGGATRTLSAKRMRPRC